MPVVVIENPLFDQPDEHFSCYDLPVVFRNLLCDSLHEGDHIILLFLNDLFNDVDSSSLSLLIK